MEEAGADDDVEAGGFDDDLEEAPDDDLEGGFDDDLVRLAAGVARPGIIDTGGCLINQLTY